MHPPLAVVDPPPMNEIKLISTTSHPIIVENHVPPPSLSTVMTKKDDVPNPSDLEKMDCKDGSLVSYWHKPTEEDLNFVSPYTAAAIKNNKKNKLREKYITFEPDVGGWNNIRMQMEVVLVFALATGRTLVIPPEQAMVQ